MSDDPKTLKFQLMLSEAEAEEIDDWGYKNRIRSRAEAMRRLCQIGLRAEKTMLEIASVAENGSAWAKKALDYNTDDSLDDLAAEDAARLRKNAALFAYMGSVATRVSADSLVEGSAPLKITRDFSEAMKQAGQVSDATLRDADRVIKFIDDFKERFPGTAFRPPEE
ncbi:hypothetical protein [Rhizobium sp. PP-CC-3G-465]|uniref:hypothetical protein n=1 Tax=Rhizobium sp. PP-CC-3G-465 TaxID=2135648 RepID=UPI00104DD3A1|nr:hypothetical protein C8J33_1011979 [Rhizobium sp. PP-CC-3G-465]